MARFKLIRGGGGDDDRPISHGQELQCDCPANGCPCTAWGPWVPAEKPIPQIVLCHKCSRGDHSG